MPRARELIRQFLQRRRAGEDADPDQLILDNPSLAGLLEQELGPLRAAWSIQTCIHRPMSGPLPGPFLAAEIGSTGRYEVMDVIGTGAFSVVYRAFDRLLRRPVALKVLRSPAAGATLAHALGEGRASARLTHPNIVPVYDLGTADGCVYLAMDLVEGGTLAEHLARCPDGRPPFLTSAQLVRQIAQALDYAHANGVVHRDVKPANVLMDTRGVPRLTDFGLARTLEERAELMGQQGITGSPAYMAPEQAAGQSEQADARTDVFSLGIVLYEMLTGGRPFVADNLEGLLRKVREDRPVPPRHLVPDVPLDLELICLKALEKLPGNRFPTAGAMETELGRWINGDPPGLRRQTRGERVRRWVRQHKVGATAAAMLALVLLVIAGSLALRSLERYRDKIRQEEVRLRERQQQDALRKAAVLVREARLELRAPMWGRVASAQKLLREALRLTATLPAGEQRTQLELDIRSTFVASLGVPDQKPLRPGDSGGLPAVFSRPWPVALHPDGRRMAVGLVKRYGGPGPMVWERGTPWPWPPTRHGELDPDTNRPRLAYSPDGRSLVFLPPTGQVQLWDGLAQRRLAECPPREPQPVVAVGFAADGSRLWCCNAGGRVFALTLPGLREVASWSIGAGVTAAAFSHDASRLAVGDKTGTIRFSSSDPVRDGGPPAPTRTLRDIDGFAVTALAWSPDSSRLAAGSLAETIQLWDIESGERLWGASSFGGEIQTLQFHPTQGWLFGGTVGHGGGLWNAETGRPLLHVPACQTGGFSADGATLAHGRPGGVGFVDLQVPATVRTLHGSANPSYHRAWSRDGRYLASLDRRFEVRTWDVFRSTAVDQFRPLRGEGLSVENAAVALSDDGRYLAYASGGDTHATLVLRDVREHVTVGTWPRRGGFERLGYSEGRFWLVREEDEGSGPYQPWPNPRPVQSVAYELEVGKAPRRLHVVRHGEPGDERRFLDQALSADGRYYLWVGPRRPPQRQRVEVWDLQTRRPIARVRCPVEYRRESLPAYLAPDGRRLSIGGPHGPSQIYDLPSPGSPRTVEGASWLSGDGRWEVGCARGNQRAYQLRPAGQEKAWLELEQDERTVLLKEVSFSPDSRYLVWPNRDGTLTLLDLPAVEARAREFEASPASEKVEKR
jgi:WD40 repeat protein